jgi:DNA-binding PadR family transcriptional regulator
MLSRAEEIILLAILQLQDDAYGISIRDFIKEGTGSEWSLAQIYDPLNRLTHKGYVLKSIGFPTPERGGRHKCLYTVTRDGKKALQELRRVQDNIWNNLPEEALN